MLINLVEFAGQHWLGRAVLALVEMEAPGMGEAHQGPPDLAVLVHHCHDLHHHRSHDCKPG